MPYGFIEHIKNNGYSHETIASYEKVLNQFFGYLSKNYNRHLEAHEINPSDIKSYLEDQIDKEKSVSTINKELAIIKTLFNYLWEKNKVPIDPAVKLKRYKSENNTELLVTLKEILDILPKVMVNTSYPLNRKVIFLLATKGLKTADYRFKRDDVLDLTDKEVVEIQLKNRKIVLEDKEASWFLEYYYESILNDSEYIFTTKSHKEEKRGPIQVMSILNHLRIITADYLPKETPPLTLLSIRRAIAYDLYTKKIPIQQIALELGIEESTASNYLKHLVTNEILKKTCSKNI